MVLCTSMFTLNKKFFNLRVCVLTSTSTGAEIVDSSKSKNKSASANPSGIRRGRKPYPLDANSNKIRPRSARKTRVRSRLTRLVWWQNIFSE